jgi:hypothetical protein
VELSRSAYSHYSERKVAMTADNNRERCPTPECDNDAVGDDHGLCVECQATHDYRQREYDRYGRREVANRYTEDDIRDCYSDPTEAAKRERLVGEFDSC